MADDIGTVEQLQAELQRLRTRHVAEIDVLRDEKAALVDEVRHRDRARREALEQQAATAAVLRVIASAPTDLQAVLDAVAENAARLCDAQDAQIFRVVDGTLRYSASHGALPSHVAVGENLSISSGSVIGRAVLERRTTHVHDLEGDDGAEFSSTRDLMAGLGVRTIVGTPLLRQGEALGVIGIRRTERRPFTPDQIRLLETFADQAVIAIENARLFSELEQRNADLHESNRQVIEALEHQTATGDVLRVIAATPTSSERVLDTIAATAARLCAVDDVIIHRVDGARFWTAAHVGQIDPQPTPEEAVRPRPINPGSVVGRAIVDRRTVHIADVQQAADEFPRGATLARSEGVRTVLAVPMIRDDGVIGVIHVRRREVRPLGERQIDLLETFANQAVIAIDNARLFQELEQRNGALVEALEHQTATAEVLRVIASSPTESRRVLQAIIEAAARLADAPSGTLQYRGDQHDAMLVGAACGVARESLERSFGPDFVGSGRGSGLPATRGLAAGRAYLEGRTIHVLDMAEAVRDEYPEGARAYEQLRQRTQVSVPLIRRGDSIGVLTMHRFEVRPFSDREIALLETFADQAVIAIENARLFEELERRNDELQASNRQVSDALERQAATAEVLGAIASTPTDLERVLQTIVDTAARLCDAQGGSLQQHRERDGRLVSRAYTGHWRERVVAEGHGADTFGAFDQLTGVPATPGSIAGRAYLEGKTLHVPDLFAAVPADFPDAPRHESTGRGAGALVSVPLLRHGQPIGVLTMHRAEARPFAAGEVSLLETFADQAVIAIENARLFEELEQRNRELGEALERQTATGEVLRIIASSPTDLQPVLEAVAEAAARLCDADNVAIYRPGDPGEERFRLTAWRGEIHTIAVARESGFGPPIARDTVAGRAWLERRQIQVEDLATAADEYARGARWAGIAGHRTTLATPLLRQGQPLGVITMYRSDVRPFTSQQLAVLQTFADQAVIAIENSSLFETLESRNVELNEALERQTATGDILRAIAMAPGALGSVLDAVWRPPRASATRMKRWSSKSRAIAFSRPLPMGRPSSRPRSSVPRAAYRLITAR